MAQTTNPRRFYIDHAGDRPVVRTVPVKLAPRPAPAVESVATHQVTAPATDRPLPSLAARARKAPKSVTNLVRTARRQSHHS